MAQFKISGSDVSELSSSLSKFSGQLPESQQALLKAIVNFSKDGLASAATNLKLDDKGLLGGGFDLTVPEEINLKTLLKDAFDHRGGIGDPSGPLQDSIGVGVTCVSWSKDYNKITNRDDLELINDAKIKNILSEIRNIKGLR